MHEAPKASALPCFVMISDADNSAMVVAAPTRIHFPLSAILTPRIAEMEPISKSVARSLVLLPITDDEVGSTRNHPRFALRSLKIIERLFYGFCYPVAIPVHYRSTQYLPFNTDRDTANGVISRFLAKPDLSLLYTSSTWYLLASNRSNLTTMYAVERLLAVNATQIRTAGLASQFCLRHPLCVPLAINAPFAGSCPNNTLASSDRPGTCYTLTALL